MKTFYIDKIKQHSIENEELLKKLAVEALGREINLADLEKEEVDVLRMLMVLLKNQILINKSPYDVHKIGRAIQYSRSGIGGSALTTFTCLFCNEKETWMNTAVPRICKNCAEEMAQNIVLNNEDLLKDQ